MTRSTKLRSRSKQAAGALFAAVLATMGVLAAMPPAGAAPGDVTTVAGTGISPNLMQGSDGVARFGNTLYVSNYSGYVSTFDLNTGDQSLYAGAPNAYGYSGDGGPATSALLGNVGAITVDSHGNVFLNENDWYSWPSPNIHCHIRRVDASTHVITTYAGSEDPDRSCNSGIGDGGNASDAGFYSIESMAFDSHDNLYVATRNNDIRRIDHASHIIDSAAGSIWDQGYVDGVTALDARFNTITGLAFDSQDNLYVADSGNNAIRKLNAAFTNVTTVVGGTLSAGPGHADGAAVGTATIDLAGEARIGMSPAGVLYIGDDRNPRIRTLSVDGTTVTTVMGDGVKANTGNDGPAVDAETQAIKGFAFDAAGGVFMSDHMDNDVRYIGTNGMVYDPPPPSPGNGDGGLATNAYFDQPIDLLRIGTSLYVAELDGNRVRKIDLTTGITKTVAGTGVLGTSGDGGPATAAKLWRPVAIAANADHSLMYIATTEGHLRMVNLTTGIISTIAGTGTACDPTDACGDGGPATDAQISPDVSLTVSPDDHVIMGDLLLHKVRCIGCTGPGIISTLAGTGVMGYSPDGTVATNANLASPVRVIVSPAGTVVFGEITTGLVREIKADGTLHTIAGRYNDLGGSGDGGLATNASIAGPVALRYDAAGDMYIGQAGGNPFADPQDFVNPAIRKIDATTGLISTFAGTTYGFSGDGGPATEAQFSLPTAIAPDAGTHLYVADLLNGRVRRIEGVKPDLTTSLQGGPFTVGETGTLVVTEHNTGAAWLTGPITTTVTLPAGLTFQSAAGANWSCSADGQTVTCTNPDNMAPDASAVITMQVMVGADAPESVSVNVAASSDSDVAHPGYQTAVLGIKIIRPETAPPVVITDEPGDNSALVFNHAALPTKQAAAPTARASDAAGPSRNATHVANASPAARLPLTGGPEAPLALLAVTFLAVGSFGIARSQRYAKQHPSHT